MPERVQIKVLIPSLLNMLFKEMHFVVQRLLFWCLNPSLLEYAL